MTTSIVQLFVGIALGVFACLPFIIVAIIERNEARAEAARRRIGIRLIG